MNIATPRRLSLEEYLNYDDGTDTRYELVDGVLVEMAPESPLNALIARFLLVHFLSLGLPLERVGDKQQIMVASSKVTAREPDLTVHSTASAAAILTQKQALIDFGMPVPDLVVEVVSPDAVGSENYDRDYVEKPIEYATRGIPEYWIIDPERAVVSIGVLTEGAYQFQQYQEDSPIVSPTFPKLTLTANQVLNAGR